MEAWNPDWATMPWKAWSSPVERFNVLPSFVIGEFVFISLALLTLAHAFNNGRRNVAVWVAALAAGTTNDAIFMVLPMVDNFWQSQACIMLTPRMPLYIPCVYIVFMYCGSICAGAMGLPLVAASCLAGIMGEAIYAPYDLTGIKFLWWTWHDTDAPVHHRILGVPIGSSAWVITFTCSYHLLLNYTSKKMGLVSSVIVTALFSTPVMVVQMALVQLISGDKQGLPTHRSLTAILIIYSLAIIIGLATRKKSQTKTSSVFDYVLLAALLGYFSFLSINMAVSDPSAHLSTGVHQEIGDCNIRAPDITGHERQVFLCKETHQQDYTFDCGALCSRLGVECANTSTTWYTVCGQPHTQHDACLNYITVVSILAALMYAYTLTYTTGARGENQEVAGGKRMKKKQKRV